MGKVELRHVYGPVFSRRLGRSLGIDLVPFKTCSYDCAYCQLGRTTSKTVARQEHVALDEVLEELDTALASQPAPDFIGLAGSGEPTLHSGIGRLIAAIKSRTPVPVAVLTNGSLLWMPEVRRDIANADLVLPSLDAASARRFRQVNRPHRAVSFERMLRGLIEFTQESRGAVWLEIMLLAGITDTNQEVTKLAALARRIGPERVQLNTVSRPPAEAHALAVSRESLQRLRAAFAGPTDVISEAGRDDPDSRHATAAQDANILALLRRRPCTVAGIAQGLGLHPPDVVKRLEWLLERGAVEPVRRNDATYYLPVSSRGS